MLHFGSVCDIVLFSGLLFHRGEGKTGTGRGI